MLYVARGNLKIRVQVVDFRRDAGEGERYEIAACVDLQGSIGGESKVCRKAGKLRGYAAIERTTCRGERCIIVKLEGWNARDGKSQQNANTVPTYYMSY